MKASGYGDGLLAYNGGVVMESGVWDITVTGRGKYAIKAQNEGSISKLALFNISKLAIFI